MDKAAVYSLQCCRVDFECKQSLEFPEVAFVPLCMECDGLVCCVYCLVIYVQFKQGCRDVAVQFCPFKVGVSCIKGQLKVAKRNSKVACMSAAQVIDNGQV